MSYPLIKPENAAALSCLGQAQFGWIAQARWSPDGNLLAIAGGEGVAGTVQLHARAMLGKITLVHARLFALASSPVCRARWARQLVEPRAS